MNKLKESREQFPERYSKSILILTTVHDNVEGDLELRLHKESRENMNERVLLIPYYLGNSHWIGILIEFQADKQIQRVEYIDPVNEIKLVGDSLHKQNTQTNSAALTIENLSIAANVQVPIMITTHISKEGNEYKLSELEQKLNIGLAKWKIRNIELLSEKIQQTLEQIETYKKDKKTKDAERETENLNELKELKNFWEEIISFSLNKKTISFLLEEDIKNGLAKYKLQNIGQLVTEIENTENAIQHFKELERDGKSSGKNKNFI